MTDNRPIGVFDSGLGGLTAVKELQRLLPCESIVYFGDSGRVPYGGRDDRTLRRFGLQNARLLLKKDVKLIVVACGTVSSLIDDDMRGQIPCWMEDVVVPAAEEAAAATRTKRIGVIGTEAAIRSGSYVRRLTAALPDAEVLAAACPKLVPLIEAGKTDPGDPETNEVLAEYLEPLRGVDTLILGCTHYPLLTPGIASFLGRGVTLIDAGAAAARKAAKRLRETSGLSGKNTAGESEFYVSGDLELFARIGSRFLGREIGGKVWYASADQEETK